MCCGGRKVDIDRGHEEEQGRLGVETMFLVTDIVIVLQG
jgi:hypothetical protein